MAIENFKFAPYSFSRISTFKSCPMKFKLSYIDKISAPSNQTLKKGSYIHHCLELYPDKPTKFYNIPEEYLPSINEIIYNFKNSELGKRILEPDVTIGKELDFGLDESLEPCSFYYKRALIRGSIDRLNYNKDTNTLEVYDYKSGKYKDPRFQTFEQTQLYAIWLFRTAAFNHVDKVRCSYVYIEHGIENELVMERKYLKQYVKEYIESIKEIEDSEEYPKNISKLCDYCFYKESGDCE